MTKEETDAQIKALLEERRGYVNRGEDDRVAQVDKELKRLGAAAEKPSTRAQKRPGGKQAETR